MALLPALGCSSGGTTGGASANLLAECTPDAAALPEGAWVCVPDSDEDDLRIECEDGGADPELIYFQPEAPEGEESSCDGVVLSLNKEGPFKVGTHDIVIFEEDEEPVEVCDAKLIVEDGTYPEAIDEPIELWPPNHKFHTISGEDCVVDSCDDDLTVTFLWATSDEPANDKGDGNTEPDIILDCDRVELRSERQGGSNGRVYTLHYQAVDDSGNAIEDDCIVAVPHDQSGDEAIDDGPAYDVTLPATDCNDGTGGAGGEGGEHGEGGEGGAGGVVVP